MQYKGGDFSRRTTSTDPLETSPAMAKQEYSKHQKSVISGYYRNMDTIMLGKLAELVSELFLAETDKKRDRLWDRAYKAMVNLKVPPAIIEHIMAKEDVQILAKNLEEWQTGKMGKTKAKR